MKLFDLLTLVSLSSLSSAAAIGERTTDGEPDGTSNLQTRASLNFGPLGNMAVACGHRCWGPGDCDEVCPYCNLNVHKCEC